MDNQTQTVKLRVKGTSFRKKEVQAATECGDLEKNSPVTLKPEPDHKIDPNAVAVFSKSGKKLGYINYEIAKRFQRLCFDGQVVSSKVRSAEYVSSDIWFDIRILVTYQTQKLPPWDSSFYPQKPGVYQISLDLGKIYIGATSNLRKRCENHLHNLLSNSHSNNTLQNDFNKSGLDSFNFRVIEVTENMPLAEKLEGKEILARLKAGEELYNKTLDGQGWAGQSKGRLNTISDYFAGIGVPKEQVFEINPVETEFDDALTALSQNSSLKDCVGDVSYSHVLKVVESHKLSSGDSYTGEILNDLPHGRGTLNFLNGDVYDGDFVNGVISGKGCYDYKNGDYYSGELANGKPEGHGQLWYGEGLEYEGGFVNGSWSGRGSGKIELKDGSLYEGNLIDGIPHGDGTLILSDGREMVGLFVEGKLNGKALVTYPGNSCLNISPLDFFTGGELEGAFLDGKLQSPVTFTYSSLGELYIGEIKEDKPHGKGTIKTDQYEYTGDFSEGELLGRGTLLFHDSTTGTKWSAAYKGEINQGVPFLKGVYFLHKDSNGDTPTSWQSQNFNAEIDYPFGIEKRFIGHIVEGKRAGEGELHYENGNIFHGLFASNAPGLEGVLILPNGVEYIGQIRNGIPDGEGCLKKSDSSLEGYFRKGELIGECRLSYDNGHVYEGMLLDNKPHGAGRLLYNNGIEFKGLFSHGEPTSEGWLSFPAGEKFRYKTLHSQLDAIIKKGKKFGFRVTKGEDNSWLVRKGPMSKTESITSELELFLYISEQLCEAEH